MNSNTPLGVVSYPNNERSDDYLFRVALKAVIINEEGEILIVKETGRDWWDIPGGGLDHGESLKEGLTRELLEEVGYVGDFEFEPLEMSEPQMLVSRNIIQVRVTFLVKPTNFVFRPGDDGDEVRFIDPDEFKDSLLENETQIYRYSQLALKRLAASE
ncbi:NUDIX hydrolase [Candidatus Saccharibacteria bacterium]|nr:NUDIX hydrolase [Candidatus Saccharibacteria bacterium]